MFQDERANLMELRGPFDGFVQPPDLDLGAFDHLFPPNQMIRGNHTLRPEDKSCPLHGTASASIQSAMEAVLET